MLDVLFSLVLTQYFPKTKVRKEKSLLGGSDSIELVEEEAVRCYFIWTSDCEAQHSLFIGTT